MSLQQQLNHGWPRMKAFMKLLYSSALIRVHP